MIFRNTLCLGLLLMLFIVPSYPQGTSGFISTFPLDVSTGFYTWVWSSEARAKITPDYKPPYDKYIELRYWSLFDPIGEPDPYKFDVVLNIRNNSNADISDVTVVILYSWKQGPISEPELGKWSESKILHNSVIDKLNPHDSQVVKVEKFSIREIIDASPDSHFPQALKIIYKIKLTNYIFPAADHESQELIIERILPITGGD